MTILQILVAALALWRICALFSYERGPFDMFLKFRELIGISHDDAGLVDAIKETWIAKLFSCVWCLSMFSSLFYVPLWYFFPEAMFWACMPFALSALAITFQKVNYG
jgi:hypothetical protein